MTNLPSSWSDLSWSQLTALWQVKMRYGGYPDVARAAALLSLLDCTVCCDSVATYTATGERQYLLRSKDGTHYTVTARELSQMAAKTLPWFDYPYGDNGEEEQKDEKGKVIKEGREGVRGYVNPVGDWHDALSLPLDKLKVGRSPIFNGRWSMVNLQWQKTFALPQVACFNLTWEQYRSLQGIASQLFQEGLTDDETLDLQAQFLAHCLTPSSFALLDTTGSSVRLRPHWEYTYNAARANELTAFWMKRLKIENGRLKMKASRSQSSIFNLQSSIFNLQSSILYHVCFQAYHTAIGYYATAYPLLFGGGKTSDTVTDALKGESRTVNAVMKYAGYSEQQQVYDSNLPFVLDILNTMAEEAKQIEQMNARLKIKK